LDFFIPSLLSVACFGLGPAATGKILRGRLGLPGFVSRTVLGTHFSRVLPHLWLLAFRPSPFYAGIILAVADYLNLKKIAVNCNLSAEAR
jgi:hypothetical protein